MVWDSFEKDEHLHTVDAVQQHKLAVDIFVRYGEQEPKHLLTLGRDNLHNENCGEDEGRHNRIGRDQQAYLPQRRPGTSPPQTCVSKNLSGYSLAMATLIPTDVTWNILY